MNAADRKGQESARVLRLSIPIKLRLGQTEAALEQSRRLAKIAPDDPFPWQMMGQIHQTAKDSPEAVAAYREALRRKLSPEQTLRSREALLGQLIAIGDLSDARGELNALGKTERTISLRMKEVYLLRLEGKPSRALQVVESILAETPSSPRAQFLRGILHLDAGRFLPAVDDLKSVVAAQPFNKEAHYKLSQAYRNLGGEKRAARHLDRSRQLTRSATRLIEVRAQLTRDPGNRTLRRELTEL
ncbi:MAG: tetratricopeptide repeat protein, partial [Chloroflexi bacterium]|nr:tetratricopeptide repeat protein [Chloroflexota bacterium]